MKPPAPLRLIVGIPVAFVAVLIPWFAFLITFILFSSKLYFADPDVAIASVCGSCVTLIIVIIIARVRAHRSRHHSGWISFVVVMVVVNFVFGYLVGEYNFFTNMLPYYDVISLNSYKNVDVSLDDINGNVLMDAGRVEFFVEGTQVDLARGNAFVASHTYCVAPIVRGSTMTNFDFWAVGLDCCEKDSSVWSCPETSVPAARGALRVMSATMRPYFHLAVEQAMSVHNITGKNPLFFFWVGDPRSELEAWKANGMYVFLVSVIISFLVAIASPAAYAKRNVTWFRW